MALTKLVVELALIDGASAGVRGLTQHLRGMGEAGAQAATKINAALTDLQAGMRAMSTAKAIHQGILEPGVAAAELLQEALTRLEVNLDPGSLDQVKAQLAEVEANAARIAAPTKFNQAQSVGIHTDLRRAGLQLSDITGQGGAAEAVTQLATVEGLSAEQSVGAITTLGSIFGLGGSEFGGAADLLSRAGSGALTDAAQLSEALAQAPSAGALGLDPTETLASLGVMAKMGVRGGAAGTSLNAFLRQAATNNDKMGLGLFDQQGSFVGLQASAERLRGMTAGKSDLQVQQAMTKAFGDEGARFAGAMLKTEGGGLEEVMANIASARSLEEKVGLMSGTKSASDAALAGTAQTVLATLFQPALAPLTDLGQHLNSVLGRVGDAARADPRLAQAASLGTMGAVAGVGLYGAARMARGGLRGLGALGGLPGAGLLGGRAANLAEAKALEAAAGVTPVAVTNWPAGLGAGAALSAPAAAAGGAGRLAMAVPLVAAGAVGYGVGSAVNSKLSETELGNAAVEGAVSSALLYSPLRALAELSDRLTGGGMVKEAQATRSRAINVVVKNLPGGGAEVEVDDGGRVQRAMARLGGM